MSHVIVHFFYRSLQFGSQWHQSTSFSHSSTTRVRADVDDYDDDDDDDEHCICKLYGGMSCIPKNMLRYPQSFFGLVDQITLHYEGVNSSRSICMTPYFVW